MAPTLHYYRITLPGSGGSSLLLAGGPAITNPKGMLDLTKPNGETIMSAPPDQVRELRVTEFYDLLAEVALSEQASRKRRN